MLLIPSCDELTQVEGETEVYTNVRYFSDNHFHLIHELPRILTLLVTVQARREQWRSLVGRRHVPL